MNDVLTPLFHPPFEKDPPVKMEINAKILGMVVGAVAALSALLGLVALPSVLGADGIACNTPIGYGCGVHAVGLLGVLVSIVGSAIAAFGGYKMMNLDAKGKEWVICGLLGGFLGSLIETLGYGYRFGASSLVLDAIIVAALYYAVVISRFPGEQPAISGSAPPPPPQAPMPPS